MPIFASTRDFRNTWRIVILSTRCRQTMKPPGHRLNRPSDSGLQFVQARLDRRSPSTKHRFGLSRATLAVVDGHWALRVDVDERNVFWYPPQPSRSHRLGGRERSLPAGHFDDSSFEVAMSSNLRLIDLLAGCAFAASVMALAWVFSLVW
jgi:hypothetical protein